MLCSSAEKTLPCRTRMQVLYAQLMCRKRFWISGATSSELQPCLQAGISLKIVSKDTRCYR